MSKHYLVEKKNHFCVHGIFESKASAEKFLKETVPVYCEKGFYIDKTLTQESFEIIKKIPERSN